LQKALGHGAANTRAASGDENAFALEEIVSEHGALSEGISYHACAGNVSERPQAAIRSLFHS
jgi:hypothetical protein